MPQLDACELEEGAVLKRYLRYGERTIFDKVSFIPFEQVCFHVPAQNEIPESSLVMSIEEVQKMGLAVRFIYEDEFEQEYLLDELRQSA